jgi:amidohydrolase
MPVINRVAALADEIAAWRQDFHRNPEILYAVERTAGIVAERLRAFGCDEVVEGIGRTGVVGVIRGRPGSRVIGLRADMDALPIEEATAVPYRSEVPGTMHACGHDGHTAMLLGAARYLAETRNFEGSAVLIFQPAEEGGGGAKAMVEDGLMDRFGIQEVYGLHNRPGLPLGTFAVRAGAMMAAADRFTITVEGRGGHAAEPHRGIDTILVASQIVTALQSIAARNADPLDAAVVSVCAMNAGTTFNVIPQTATLLGTVRTVTPEMRDLCEARIGELASGVAGAYGASARTEYLRGYPVTQNHAEQVSRMVEAARSVAGEAGVDLSGRPMMASEDFSYMLESRPGAYIFLGIGPGPDLHHPAYDFNDAASPYGVSLWAKLVEGTA